MTPRSARSARKDAAQNIIFKLVAMRDGVEHKTQMPYVSDVIGGLCLKGFSEESLKFIRSSLYLPKTQLVMAATWQGETYPISSAGELGTFMSILHNAKVRDLESVGYLIKVDVKVKAREYCCRV